MAALYSPMTGSLLGLLRSWVAASMWSEAVWLSMAWVTKDPGSRWIGSTPDGPRSVNANRRGIPEGSAKMSCAWRARMTVQTWRRTSTLMEVGSRLVVPRARLKS